MKKNLYKVKCTIGNCTWYYRSFDILASDIQEAIKWACIESLKNRESDSYEILGVEAKCISKHIEEIK